MAEMTREEQLVQQQTQTDEALLAVLRQRFEDAEEHERASRRDELDDQRFSHGEQWPADIANRRRMDNRPSLTINQIPQFVRQVTNEQRQNRPAIRVMPVDDFADPDTAKVLQGLIRHIEANSDADVAYDTAFEQAVRSGKGYFRIVFEYEDHRTFHQSIKIKRIRNRFAVYMDPASQEVDGSDAQWGMIVSRMNRDVFRQMYPDADASPMSGWTSEGDGWMDTDEVRVCEYFYLDRVKRELLLLDDGSVHEQAYAPSGREVIATREAYVPQVWWIKSNGYTVLERARFPGRFIPIIPVIGDECDLNGEVSYSGIVRHSKDSQRMYNYWASAETETIALAPRAPWVGAEGQFEGHEQEWAAANTQNIAFLQYKPKTHGNTLVPPPQRNSYEPAIQAITNARLMSRDDLKATTGIYDASLGARSNEQSGRAIIARQREGDVANFHFPDNLARALRHAGRILVGMIPEIYSTARVIRILGEDNTANRVQLNAPFTDENGIDRIYRPGVGRYDVRVDVGPSFATKRQETVATMMDLTKAYPALFQVAGDLLVKNMDWPGAEEIAERLVSLLPPDLRPQPPGSDPKAQLSQLQAALPELQKKLEAMHAYAQEVEGKARELEEENVGLKLQSQNKAGELALKQEETASRVQMDEAKVGIEGRKLQLEEQKLQLEEQRLALEVAKAQADIGDMQTRMATEAREQAQANGDMDAVREGYQAVAQALQTIQMQLESVNDQLMENEAARRAPKSVSITRREDGTLVGAVSSEGDIRTVEIRPSSNGFQGEVT